MDLSETDAPIKIRDYVVKLRINIDLLVNNAGIGNYGFFTETDWRRENKIIMLNILAVTHLSKIFAQIMKKKNSGCILNIASTASFQPGPLMAVYYASKAYVLNFTEAIANELRGSNVKVIAFCPGPTKTNFQDTAGIRDVRIHKSIFKKSSSDVAEAAFRSIYSNRTVVVYGFFNNFFSIVVKYVPREFVTKIMRWLHE